MYIGIVRTGIYEDKEWRIVYAGKSLDKCTSLVLAWKNVKDATFGTMETWSKGKMVKETEIF